MDMPQQTQQQKEQPMVYHTSRFSVARYYVLAAIIVAVAAVFYELNGSTLTSVISVALLVVILVLTELKVRLNKVLLGSRGMTIETGMFSKSTTRLHYQSIVDIRVSQSFFQRMFGYGNIEIGVPGATIQQNVRQQFAGRGDVKISGLGSHHKGIVVHDMQNVREMERFILSRKG